MTANLTAILAGLLCFFNPVFNMFDIVPDFLGAILIMLGLSKMYMINADFEEAKRSAKFLLWISVLKLFLCIWTVGGNKEYIMPFTFLLCVLEVIYGISLIRSIYSGLEYTLMRGDCEGHVKGISEAFTMSFIFVIGSKILEFAPHITDIFAQDAEFDLSAGASFKMSMAQMKVYVYFVTLVLGLIFGLIYAFVISKAWTKLICDKKYKGYLLEKYNDYTRLFHDAFIEGKITTLYLFVTLSFGFFIDFYIDAVNVIPTFIAHLLLAMALCMLVKYASVSKIKAAVFSVLGVTVSAVNYIYLNRVHLGINYLYSVESYNLKEFKLLERGASIYITAALSLAEFIFAIILMYMVLSGMKKLFAKEKRSVALPMIRVQKVLCLFALFAPVVRNTLNAIEGHLATNEKVMGYVQNKAFLTNEITYNSLMQNPDIARYEKVSSFAYGFTFAAAILCLICILYNLRIMRFTDGEKK